jgi:hypothetical protein
VSARPVKRATIYVSVGEKTGVYNSFAAVPSVLRKRIFGARTPFSTATLIIADRLGRKELLRLARGESSLLRLRALPASAPEQPPKSLSYLRIIAALCAGVTGALMVWLALSFR